MRINQSGSNVTGYIFMTDTKDSTGGLGGHHYIAENEMNAVTSKGTQQRGLYKIVNGDLSLRSGTRLQSTSYGWGWHKWVTYHVTVKGNHIKIQQKGANDSSWSTAIDYVDNDNPIETGSYGFAQYSMGGKFKDITVKNFTYSNV